MHVAVAPSGELESRAASALAAHPEVERLGLIGKEPPTSWGGRVVKVDDATGFEVVVGEGGGAAARAAGAVLVVPGPPPDEGPTVAHASPTGLARVLAVRLPGPASMMARTVLAAPPAEGRSIAFPLPVGWTRVVDEEEGVARAAVSGSVAAASATSGDVTLAVVDDLRFLESACLAAGAFLAHLAIERAIEVWEHPEDYLRACEALGLVVGETVSADRR